MANATIIEQETTKGMYGLNCTEAIIEHPAHGRLYISQGFGGMGNIEGGMYRWRHGVVCKLQPGDTLASLRREASDTHVTIHERMVSAYDDSRPVLEWSGSMIAECTEAAGL